MTGNIIYQKLIYLPMTNASPLHPPQLMSLSMEQMPGEERRRLTRMVTVDRLPTTDDAEVTLQTQHTDKDLAHMIDYLQHGILPDDNKTA